MEGFNSMQREFLEQLAGIQEAGVQTALCRKRDCPLEDRFYEITADVIIQILEIFDGYAGMKSGGLHIVCEKTGEPLKKNPSIELHDAAAGYLKGLD